jgi:hypothetical protein
MHKLILILPVLVGFVGPLAADTLTYTITPNSGQFLYQFTLTNTGSTGGTLLDLFLSLPTDISDLDRTAIGTPAGWGDPTGGLLFFGPDSAPLTSFIQWSADVSGTSDVGIGKSLSGFSFNSTANVGTPIAFALNGSTTFVTAQEVSGIPEPATARLILLAIATVCTRSRLGLVRRS